MAVTESELGFTPTDEQLAKMAGQLELPANDEGRIREPELLRLTKAAGVTEWAGYVGPETLNNVEDEYTRQLGQDVLKLYEMTAERREQIYIQFRYEGNHPNLACGMADAQLDRELNEYFDLLNLADPGEDS